MSWVIAPLADYPQHRELTIDWLWRAFGQDTGRRFYCAMVDNGMRRAGLPIAFIALDGDRPVGTVGLWRCDLLTRQDLTPWLAALYVDESWRGRGLGEALQRFVIDFSRRAGYDRLYLYATFRGYYEREGWKFLADGIEYPDKPVFIYHLSGGAEPSGG